jgi:hypothetical protein
MEYKSSKRWAILKDGRTLKSLESKGLINKPPTRASPARGKWGSCYCYVEALNEGGLCEDSTTVVKVKKNKRSFRLKYFSGCFLPYVIELVNK